MNILYLAHRIPYPPNKGDKLRAFRQLQRLSERHKVWCACFVDGPEEYQYLTPLRGYCQEVAAVELRPVPAKIRGLWNLLRGGTVTEAFYRHREMSQLVQRWSRSVGFDAVVAFSSSMAPYALSVPTRRRVLDLCDCDSRKWLDYAEISRLPARWLYRVEGKRLARKERGWLQAFDATILITRAEAAMLLGGADHKKLHIVGNGVRISRVHCDRLMTHPTIGFVGVMDYRPNVDAVCWFVRECWGAIRDAHGDVEFRIVGRSPTRAVRKLAKVPGVTVVGGVDDVAWELDRFDVSIAPMRIARGLQNKVLEAMACGIPVVLTSEAAEGIDGRNGRDYIVTESVEAMIRNVRRLLRDEEERKRVGAAGRSFVEKNHRWDDVLDKFEIIVTGIVDRSAPATDVMTRPRASSYDPAVLGEQDAALSPGGA
ncbi:MAG: TIGR03087 family PEP-CTERM/XrtA system glycosyltransferase [Planctomycetes bacterium]|nr:TIGR03087 family PEP-CTERM/XrtA system glycosyltransferase [Planctomycetota bacterium]